MICRKINVLGKNELRHYQTEQECNDDILSLMGEYGDMGAVEDMGYCIYKGELKLGEGGGSHLEYINANSPEEARRFMLEYLDYDVYEWTIIKESFVEIDSLPADWRSRKPNAHNVFR